MSIAADVDDAKRTQTILLARAINILALLGLLGVLAGSLDLQFAVGEQPCPLCLVQRSAMIGLAVGPAMNLLWGMRARHYAVSILAALAGMAGSIRQILLHIADPTDLGYGPAILGYHLYTWAFVTFVVGIAGCALLLMWQRQFDVQDDGVLGSCTALRVASLGVVLWVAIDLVLITLSVIPECGVGMCPDNPPTIAGLGQALAITLMVVIALGCFAVAYAVDKRRRARTVS